MIAREVSVSDSDSDSDSDRKRIIRNYLNKDQIKLIISLTLL